MLSAQTELILAYQQRVAHIRPGYCHSLVASNISLALFSIAMLPYVSVHKEWDLLLSALFRTVETDVIYTGSYCALLLTRYIFQDFVERKFFLEGFHKPLFAIALLER
jgi:hypothetical protein